MKYTEMIVLTYAQIILTISCSLQIYAEMIGNVMIDARSTGKYYHCKYLRLDFHY